MERTHPVTAAMYFLSVILITAIVQSPVFMAEALVCSAVFAFLLNGKTAARTLFVMLPMALLAAVFKQRHNRACKVAERQQYHA
jgi:energy-coupling factor transport system permease protein